MGFRVFRRVRRAAHPKSARGIRPRELSALRSKAAEGTTNKEIEVSRSKLWVNRAWKRPALMPGLGQEACRAASWWLSHGHAVVQISVIPLQTV